MEFEKKNSREMFLEGSEDPRIKTSNRMFYEAQVSVIQKQLGNLEKIRMDLGLSQRKICQLLMVDPSAWTRWNRDGEEAPPHIWRALQWYMTLQEKIPGLTPQYFIGKDPQVLHQKALSELNLERQERIQNIENLTLQLQNVADERNHLRSEILGLKKDLNFHKKISIFVLLLSISWAAAFFIWKGL